MRKLKLNPDGFATSIRTLVGTLPVLIITLFISIVNLQIASAQCTPVSSNISGSVFLDGDFNGTLDLMDPGLEAIEIVIYDQNGLLGSTQTDPFGYFNFGGLTDGNHYRLEYGIPESYAALAGSQGQGEMIRFSTAPACNLNLLVHDPLEYSSDDQKIAISKFIQGGANENDNISTILSVDYNFETDKSSSPVTRKAETGSIWGMAFSKRTQKIYSSAFVKQYAQLGPGGLGAIYASEKENDQYRTSLYIDLVAAGVNLGQLSPVSFIDCEYGAQTGRLGLGGLDISDKHKSLYTINIYNHSLLQIPISEAGMHNIREIALPTPDCSDSEYYAFAVTYYKDKLYVGMTCTAESSQLETDMVAHVYEYDLETKSFSHVFETDYLKGYWLDFPATDVSTKHYLTDITFTDEGNMLLSLSDRTGNRYCFGEAGRLDVQNGDLLVVWNDNGTWKLENNGTAGGYTGTGVGNNEGPGGGEFFGLDAWPKNPALHPETAVGSALVVEGSGEVIVPVYDPETSAYSGGLKKFKTSDGTLTGVTTIYNHKIYPEFGKAAGFGELVLLCDALPVEIGNYVWLDEDKDGIQDPGEPGIQDIELGLYDDQCNLLSTTTTDVDGFYLFKDLHVDKQYYVAVIDQDFDATKGYINKNSMNLYPAILDKGFGDLKDMNDNDGSYALNVCAAFDGNPYIPFHTDGSGNNIYHLDFGFTNGKIFDLALIKELVQPSTIAAGDTVTFKLNVYNQGTEPAYEIIVIDYLNDGFLFEESLNLGWKFRDGNAKFKFNGIELNPGEQVSTLINLIILPGQPVENYINYAEITSALDSDGNAANDVDSSMDEDPNNDAGGVPSFPNAPDPHNQTDDQLDGNGIDDEDDHDVAMVRIFDLALKKMVKGDRDVFFPGEKVDFEFIIYNQGNETAESFIITDYLPDELIFEMDDNTGWYDSGNGLIQYSNNTKLYPNAEQKIDLTLRISEDAEVQDIINYGEISSMAHLNDPNVRDFDSTPNTIKSDDAGGIPGTESDNQIFNTAQSAVADEDDADPAIIHIQNFDLALTKRAVHNNAKPGELVEFEIEVFNQGSIPANDITIVDYIPAGLSLEDPAWELDPQDAGKALYTASVDNGGLSLLGLTAGKSAVINITFRVDENQPLGLITNYAEIKSAYDISGNNLGIYDEDSTPDDNRYNDNGGVVNTPTDNQIDDDGTIDEDDADPAQIYISEIVLTESCICLNTATNPDDGLFRDEWGISAPSGQIWNVSSSTGIVYFTPGSGQLTELMTIDGSPNYRISGAHVDGEGYSITFENNLGDIEVFERASGSCVYEDLIINGPRGTCGDPETYSIANPEPGAIYTWSVTGANSFLGGVNTGNEVVVDWTDGTGSYELSVSNFPATSCQAPAVITVGIGAAGGSLVADDEIVVSLNGFCEAEVTPQTILEYGYDPNASYVIDLITPDGTVLPSNVITAEYLNIPLMVVLEDMCGGNRVMSIITGVDNLPPVLDCTDEMVMCDQMDVWEGPVVTDNCDQEAYAILQNEVIFNEDCNSAFSQRIEQTYIAVDASGNQSAPCVKTIYIERANTEEVDWPESLLVVDNQALVCGSYPMCPVCVCDTFPYPDPLATGVPMLNGEPLYPSSLGHCQFMVSFQDVVLINTPCYKKMARYWSVHEICDNVNIFNIINYRQEIEIIDNIPPIPVAPNNISMTTNGMDCGAMVQLPALEYTDNCSDDIRVDITYPGGFKEDQNGAFVWIPKGEHTVWYTIYDECNNYSQVEMTVNIVDETPPVAVCQDYTTVALTSDGFAEVPAYVFDSGSYDDCSVVNMEVRRMEEENSCGLTQNVFGPYITFCCDDVGKDIMVVLKVSDESGNSNECMVNVQVQDVVAPILTVPADLTIDCTFPIDFDNLDVFGVASVYDVCGATIIPTFEDHLSSCGVGYIDRFFTATDGMTVIVKRQRITVENTTPFDSLSIIWPEDYLTAASCDPGDLSPQNLDPEYAFPILNAEDQCDQVGFNYEDTVFPIEEEGNACYMIVRTWKVMDWCQFENGEYETWSWDQLIKVSNTMDPTIESDLSPIETCSFDSDCLEGYIELSVTGDDDCTPGSNLFWSYQIDLDKDGVIDEEDTYRGATLDLSKVYKIGEHVVYYTLADFCGNKTVGIQEFTIKNCKKPTPVCIDHLNIAIQATDTDGDGLPDTEGAFIDAIQFDGGSFHSCGYPLTYSFSIDTSDNRMWVDCEDVSFTGITIRLYVTDIFGNYDYCETILIVQDNNDDEICETTCVVYPEGELFIDTCDPDLSPEGLNSSVTVEGNCPCQDYEITFVDVDISDGSNSCQLIQRNWFVTFNCGQESVYDFQQLIEIRNVEAPALICADDVLADAPANCEAFVNVPIPIISSDACNTGMFITHDSPYADNPGSNASGTYPVGTTLVTFTLEDECGNQSTCSLNVIVYDVSPPDCNAANLTVQLGANGMVTITADQIDDGSSDACGVASLEVHPNTFGCIDIGDNEVTLTVTDINGLQSTCTAIVTVEDNSGELCSTQDIEIILDGNGFYVLEPEEIYTGSSCGGLDVTLEVDPANFDCDDLGENIVTLTVTEGNGNMETCEAIVTVTDTIRPVCALLEIDAYLDANGELVVTFEDIDDGSFDPCGEIIETLIANNEFTCEDVGEQTVTVTFTDNNNNVSVCETTVTVIDSIAPQCLTTDITVQIGPNGDVIVTGADVDAGSNDECGIDTILVEPSIFTCADVGENTVTVTVFDNNGVSSTCSAIVTVEDESGPLCSTQDIEVILDGNGIYVLDPEEIYTGSPCGGGDISLEVDPATLTCDDIGEVVVTLTVTDGFGNTESCDAIVTVRDTIDPICSIQDFDAYLDNNGLVVFGFDDLDNGSVDPCGEIVSTELSANSFDCDQLGEHTVMVTLTDNSGNISTCESVVTVIDSISPVCVPQDMLLVLNEFGEGFITGDDVDGGSFDNCGPVTVTVEPNEFFCNDIGFFDVVLTVEDGSGNTSECIAVVEVVDEMDPEIICPADTTISCEEWPITDYSVFGSASAFDECALESQPLETVIESVNICGIGIVTRNFIVSDVSGNTSTCTQIITIENTDDTFDEDNIMWGMPTINTESCNPLEPEMLGGEPSYLLDNVDCYLIGESYEDTDLNPGSCPDTIQRTWTVVDTCQYNELTGEGIWTFNQIIIVTDTIAPEIFAPGDTVICGEGYIDLYGYATDCGSQMGVDATNDSNFADNNNVADASGDYIVGDYTINITATDQCNNLAEYSYEMTILDEYGTCYKIVRNIDDQGLVILQLDEIFEANYDCFDDTSVTFSLDIDDINKDTLHYNCNDLGDLSSIDIPVPIFVWIDGIFIEEYCDGTLTLRDPFNFCDDSGFALIGGTVETFYGDAVETVSIASEGSVDMVTSTGETGSYAFPLVEKGGNYMISASRNNDVLNGVSTLDLIHIQRHILGIKGFEEANQYIAADINNSKAISGADIYALRNVLLGIEDEFRNNESWIFLPAEFEFLHPNNPLLDNLEDAVIIEGINRNYQVDWKGIKIGDVNASAIANEGMRLEERSADQVLLYAEEVKIEAGRTLYIPIRLDEASLLNGMQFTLKFDQSKIEFVNIESEKLTVSSNNYGLNRVKDGLITFSWHEAEPVSIESGDALFAVEFKAKSNANLTDILSISDEIIRAEWYTNSKSIKSIITRFGDEQKFTLLQNRPNPWANTTEFIFSMPENALVQINIRDVFGRLIKNYNYDAIKGLNSYVIDQSDFDAKGILLFEIEYNGMKRTRKMIKIK